MTTSNVDTQRARELAALAESNEGAEYRHVVYERAIARMARDMADEVDRLRAERALLVRVEEVLRHAAMLEYFYPHGSTQRMADDALAALDAHREAHRE